MNNINAPFFSITETPNRHNKRHTDLAQTKPSVFAASSFSVNKQRNAGLLFE